MSWFFTSTKRILEAAKHVKFKDACEGGRERGHTTKEIDRTVFEALCEWRARDHADALVISRNEVCSIIEHCRRNGVKIP